MTSKQAKYYKMFTKNMGEFYGRMDYDKEKKKFLIVDIIYKEDIDDYEQFLEKIEDRLDG
jgi:hypothetical protein